MPCTITNLTERSLNIPVVDDILQPRQTRHYAYVEHDVMMNDSRILQLLSSGKIDIPQESGTDFSAAWDSEDALRLEPYQVWIDEQDHLRIVDGTATSDLDGIPVGGTPPRNLVQDQVVHTHNRSFAQVRASFWAWWPDPHMSTWDAYWKYCLWSVAATNGAHALEWSTPTRFDSEDELFSYMESYLPTSGDRYNESTALRLYDEVDLEDTYPGKLVFRNSLVASMAGRRRWSRKGTRYYGVSSAFNAPSYYANFYNQLGQRFVQTYLSVTPPTNNDDCIWYQRATKGLWHWPVAGAGVTFESTRGAVWDTDTSSWVTPAPSRYYIVQSPFLLYELRKNRVLAATFDTGAPHRERELNAVAAWVFPLVADGRYHAFLVCPHSVDTWSTTWHDPAQYKVMLKLRYPGTYRHRYVEIEPTPTVWSNGERHMWNIFDPSGSGSLLLNKHEGAGYASDIDNNCVPTKVYVSRRNLTTGQRSKWQPLLDVKRRIKNASFRVQPAV